ncbi:hypothetical protein J1N35_036939 [Gossypium stocksii]|uniref:Uncharacterized protein n=1 Tax=Gossypium stocksii TaxID=47602 RepID=A0A9D3UJM1_9ROSI|nr:hypothetical protein J1N35_036939 [Gossypium stocksii]
MGPKVETATKSTRECSKMCLHAVNSSSEPHKLVSISESPIFILLELGYSTTENQFMSHLETHDLVEDG